VRHRRAAAERKLRRKRCGPFPAEQWLSVFPDGERRLVTSDDLRKQPGPTLNAGSLGNHVPMASNATARDFPYGAPEYISSILRILQEDGKEHSTEEIRAKYWLSFRLHPSNCHFGDLVIL
jgi:hypothetical protein